MFSFLPFSEEIQKKIIDLWKTGKITLCLSDTILDEYIDVLQRIGLKDEEELEELLLLFRKGFSILFTTKTPHINIIPNDPADNKIIECAVALKADVIISGDKEILKIGQYGKTKILTPKQFLDKFQ